MTDVEAKTLPPVRRAGDPRQPITIEQEQLRARRAFDDFRAEHRDEMRALHSGMATLNTRLEHTLVAVEKRGWTRWPVTLVTVSAVAIAAAEVGARLGWW